MLANSTTKGFKAARLAKASQRHISSKTATTNTAVFGAYGFVGPYIIQRLGVDGAPITVPVRGPWDRWSKLRVMGDLGQVVPVAFDPKSELSIRSCLNNTDRVVCNIGGSLNRMSFDLRGINRDIPRAIAKAAKEAGAKRFVYISCLGAREDSPSEYHRSKYAGEVAVREAFPEATILRPAKIFGVEDRFLNYLGHRMTSWKYLPIVGNGNNKMQPVYVNDVARAVEAALEDPSTAGKVYELGGPEVMSIRQMVEQISKVLEMNPEDINLKTMPGFFLNWLAELNEFRGYAVYLLGRPELTRHVLHEFKEDIVVSPDALSFKDLGITPEPLGEHAADVLRRFFRPGHIFIKSI